jgi:hypothetical protein
MKDETDMSTPVTRGELRQELEHFRRVELREELEHFRRVELREELEHFRRVELREELEHFRQDFKQELATKQELEHAVSQLATKQELEHAVSQLATKQELEHAVSQLATKQELEWWGGALLARLEPFQGMEQRILAELGRHTNASQESMSKEISVIDEKYADLPGRVTRLESEVLARRRR